METTNRRIFLRTAALSASTVLLLPSARALQKDVPQLPAALVKDFVIAGHGNLPKVQEMLATTPALLNATWDWGNGDFETAIEGAGHVGNRETAEYLLAQGAMLSAFPNLKSSKGPHGLMLVHHATKGGEPSKAVLEYLREIGAG